MIHNIEHEGQVVGQFWLSPLPGCPKIAVSHHLEIYEAFRGRGLGHKSQQERLSLARSLGYKVIMATVRGENEIQEKILGKAGWRRGTFYECEDGHTVHLWIRNLADPYEQADFFKGGGCR